MGNSQVYSQTTHERVLQALTHAVQMLEDIQRGKSFPAMEYVNRVRVYRETLDRAIAEEERRQTLGGGF